MLMSTDSNHLGSKLKHVRETRKLALGFVSERTGIAYSTLADLETRARDKITAIFLVKLAKVYQVTVEELIRGDAPAEFNPADTPLSPEELELIEAFRNAGPASRGKISAYVAGQAEAAPAPGKKAKATSRAPSIVTNSAGRGRLLAKQKVSR